MAIKNNDEDKKIKRKKKKVNISYKLHTIITLI